MPGPTPFVLAGGHRALDFVNTEIASDGARRDLLTGFSDLVHWLEQMRAIDRGTASSALARWNGKREGAAVLAEARRLRAALRRAVEAAAAGRPVPRSSLTAINGMLQRGALTGRVLPAQSGGFTLRRGLRLREPTDLLVPVAEAAGDLLCAHDLGRVRRCAHPACILYFLDATKNGTRRWCDMRTCGNRMNAAAYYRRRRRARPSIAEV
ncbi:MAG TPA: CGNR zinc finger domain-containing protein [Gemmatimonadales bacterium]